MTSVIDRLPGQSAVLASVKGLVTEADQINAPQRVSGRSGQLGYAVESPVEWDITAVLGTSSTSYGYATFSVRFVGDGTQKFPIAIISTDIRVNGVSAANTLQYDTSLRMYRYVDDSGEVTMLNLEIIDVDYIENQNEMRWTLAMSFSGPTTVRMKARAQATSPGTISIVRIS